MNEIRTEPPGTEAGGVQVTLQSVYLKDCSYESPNGPRLPNSQAYEPKFQLNMNTTADEIGPDVREVLLDRDRFSAAPLRGAPPGDIFMGLPQLNAMDGEGHDRLRRLLAPFFGREGTERLGAAISGVAPVLVGRLARMAGLGRIRQAVLEARSRGDGPVAGG